MRKITLVCVGTLKEKYWREALDEYALRLRALCDFSVVELSETKMPQNPSQKQIEAAVGAEGEKILAAVPPGALTAALCIEGREYSSPELASLLEKSASDGKGDACFLIGGSWGLSDAVKKRADIRLSFGRMTFPHQLFRIMLTEQIYRAFMINAGTKYHK